MDVPHRAPAAARHPQLGPRPFGSSKRLAARAAAGDERAFTLIFERHHQELYRYCLAILRRPVDAEDALQSTMSKALQALPGEHREIDLRPWLYRVAHNESISILRARSVPSGELDERTPGPARDEPAAQAELSERMRQLVADLGSLPDRQRSALVMRELSGLGYGEIASVLDCGEGAARQTVFEARSALLLREEGRSMDCAEARLTLSDGDRRRLRGRKLRAHLAGCPGCRDFRTAIDARRSDLQALCPPLPAAAAAGVLGGLLSSGAAGGGAGIGALGAGAGATGIAGGVGSAAAVKGASVVAAVVLAAGGADVAGVIDLPNPLRGSGGGEQASSADAPASAAAAGGGGSAGANGARAGGHATADGKPGGSAPTRKGKSNGRGRGGGGKGKANGAGSGGAGGEAGNSGRTPPGQSGETGTNGNGSSGTTGPPGNSNAGGNGNGVPGGGSSQAPGQTGTAPGQSTAPGQNATAPGQSKTPGTSAGNGAPSSGSATAPGQTGTPPETSNAGGNGKKSADTT